MYEFGYEQFFPPHRFRTSTAYAKHNCIADKLHVVRAVVADPFVQNRLDAAQEKFLHVGDELFVRHAVAFVNGKADCFYQHVVGFFGLKTARVLDKGAVKRAVRLDIVEVRHEVFGRAEIQVVLFHVPNVAEIHVRAERAFRKKNLYQSAVRFFQKVVHRLVMGIERRAVDFR